MFHRKRQPAAAPPPPPARPQPTTKDLSRQNQRVINRAQRELQRERMKLEMQEKKIISEIKTLSRQGRVQDARVLAKHLVSLRQKKAKTYQAGIQAASIGMEADAAVANAKVVDVISKTTDIMKRTGQSVNQAGQMEMLQQFGMEKEKYQLQQEMTDEMLDSALGDVEIDEAGEDVLNSVLDEIGLEVGGGMGTAPIVQPKINLEAQRLQDADDLQMRDRLAKLGAPSANPHY